MTEKMTKLETPNNEKLGIQAFELIWVLGWFEIRH